MNRRADVAAVLLLAAAPWLLYRKVLRLWWMLDDPFQLHLIRGRSVLSLFVDRQLWHDFIGESFTPLLFVSLGIDLAAFGTSAVPFYAHQLIAFALIAPLLCLLLRQWLPTLPAALGALLAILGVPAVELAMHLMVRHYVEGLALALGAAIAYALAARRDSLALALLSALLSLGAASAKEIFVPLPILLAFLPLPRRARMLVPQACALGAYVVWRMISAGVELHAYGWVGNPLQTIALLPVRAARSLIGPAFAAGVVMLILLLIAAIRAIARERAWLLAIVAIGIALAPIAPVSIVMQPRYLLGLWVFAAIAAAFAARAGRAGLALLCALVVAAFLVNRGAWASSYRTARRMSDEALVFSVLQPDDLLLMPATPQQTLLHLGEMTGSQAQVRYDDVPLCAGRVTPKRVFGFDASRREVRELAKVACTPRRPMPLSVTLHYEREALHWSLGIDGAHGGQWRAIVFDGVQGFDVPAEAAFRMPNPTPLTLRFRYDAPEGWMAETPDFSMQMREGEQVRWPR